MNLQLTDSVKNYFAAANNVKNNASIEQIADCFTEDAVVMDEGGQHQGRAAIQTWAKASQQKYQFTAEPINTSEGKSNVENENVNNENVNKENLIITANVTGNFPGSPIQLHYAFSLKDNKIQSLEIY